MSNTFSPKITYKMAAMSLGQRKPTTPWEYLDNWAQSDRGPDETIDKLNERMQNRWPGKYKIVSAPKWNDRNYWIKEYEFEFNSPKDETWFKLKYK